MTIIEDYPDVDYIPPPGQPIDYWMSNPASPGDFYAITGDFGVNEDTFGWMPFDVNLLYSSTVFHEPRDILFQLAGGFYNYVRETGHFYRWGPPTPEHPEGGIVGYDRDMDAQVIYVAGSGPGMTTTPIDPCQTYVCGPPGPPPDGWVPMDCAHTDTGKVWFVPEGYAWHNLSGEDTFLEVAIDNFFYEGHPGGSNAGHNFQMWLNYHGQEGGSGSPYALAETISISNFSPGSYFVSNSMGMRRPDSMDDAPWNLTPSKRLVLRIEQHAATTGNPYGRTRAFVNSQFYGEAPCRYPGLMTGVCGFNLFWQIGSEGHETAQSDIGYNAPIRPTIMWAAGGSVLPPEKGGGAGFKYADMGRIEIWAGMQGEAFDGSTADDDAQPTYPPPTP